jgi:predicted ABC-type transport system involved in lysophospholipase L1 biosynthesis ATPase subunit
MGADLLHQPTDRRADFHPPEVLAFDRVSKRHLLASGSELHVLSSVSVKVSQGATVALLGRSGSGKSTFLHLAAGIDAPSDGSVRLLGLDLAALSDRERSLARRDGVGLVFQFFHLVPHLPVLENVLVPAMIAGDPLEAARARARDLLARVDLGARERDGVQKLSGGEAQRVAVCRALLRRPRLLLADEPTGNLDEEAGARVMELLLGLAREEGAAVVYATHSREIAALAGEAWRLRGGALERA